MKPINLVQSESRKALYRKARLLAIITIVYNIIEGVVSVWLGMEDETIALMGFGLDSFVEVVSGLGILHMVRRAEGSGRDSETDRFEATALRLTGGAFYLLSAGLAVTAVISLYASHKPETTLWGVVISLVSILTMWALLSAKLKVGRALGSDAIVADAHCTRACMWLSVALLVSSLGYELTGIGGMDAVGAGFIAWLSLREGREAFEKARGGKCSCAGECAGG